MLITRDVRQSVGCSVAEVMTVAADLARLPEWARGFASGVDRVTRRPPEGETGPGRDIWIVDAPFGRVEVEFSIDVARGILDHDVTMPDGTVVHNRLRVEPRSSGSELVFTVPMQQGQTDEQWRADVLAVADDLRRLAHLCESIHR